MTQDQDNITTMFQTTVQFLDAHNAVWSGTPAFADAVTRAKAGIAEIDAAADEQETPTTGITQDKGSVRDDLEEKLLELADQLSALATKTGDATMGAQVEMSKSSLDKMDDRTLEQTAERVGALATANIAALAAYGVVAADVTALDTARTTFAGMKTAPRDATSERKSKTMSLPTKIASVRSIFRNEIDKMATKKKKSDPDFYNGYFAARVIVNRAATQKPKPAAPTPKP